MHGLIIEYLFSYILSDTMNKITQMIFYGPEDKSSFLEPYGDGFGISRIIGF